MLNIIDYILNLYPSEWLLYLQEDFDESGEAGVIIQHPKNKAIKLDLIIMKDIVGIWILKTSESDIEIDFSGFDYVFEQHEMQSLEEFLRYFFKTGNLKSRLDD